jgi:type IV secretory pathway VirB3-like protein
MVKVKLVFAIGLMILVMPILAIAETVGVFFDSNVTQIKFAATDVKTALESKKIKFWRDATYN